MIKGSKAKTSWHPTCCCIYQFVSRDLWRQPIHQLMLPPIKVHRIRVALPSIFRSGSYFDFQSDLHFAHCFRSEVNHIDFRYSLGMSSISSVILKNFVTPNMEQYSNSIILYWLFFTWKVQTPDISPKPLNQSVFLKNDSFISMTMYLIIDILQEIGVYDLTHLLHILYSTLRTEILKKICIFVLWQQWSMTKMDICWLRDTST